MNPKTENEIIKTFQVDDLLFDPLNPRLPTSINKGTDDEVYDYMIREANVTDLMLSIAEQGFFPGEPLLVVKSDTSPGKFEVVEGNRRLAALKLLTNPKLAPLKKNTVDEIASQAKFRPTEVSVIEYPSRDAILLYLGYRHITGVQEWDSLAKARYLDQLKRQFNESDYQTVIRKLAKLIGSRIDYVHKLLTSYKLFIDIENSGFYGIPNLNEENFNFSLLTTALFYSNITTFVGIKNEKSDDATASVNQDHLKELTEWIYKETEGKTRLGDSRNLNSLNKIVSQPKALESFRLGRPLTEATLFTDEPIELLSKSISDSLRRMNDGFRAVPQIRELDNLSESRSSLNQILDNVKETIRTAQAVRDSLQGVITDIDIDKA